MELHPSRINVKKPTRPINAALNLARPYNREPLKPRDHRPEQGQVNFLKLRCFTLLECTPTQRVLTFITPSSAAVCKLIFCGNLLRSKTTKKRLTNCRAHEVRGAAATCYTNGLFNKPAQVTPAKTTSCDKVRRYFRLRNGYFYRVIPCAKLARK